MNLFPRYFDKIIKIFYIDYIALKIEFYILNFNEICYFIENIFETKFIIGENNFQIGFLF